MPRGERRLTALAAAARALSAVSRRDRLVEVAGQQAIEVLGADAASMSELDHAHGCLRTVFNAGALADWEQRRPTDEVYPLVDYPEASRLLERGGGWCGSLDDADLPAGERTLLRSLGRRSALSVSVLLGSRVWGELYLTRGADWPVFGPADVAMGEAFAGLVSAAMTHLDARDALHTMAYRDSLTGLANRRAVDERLEDAFAEDALERPIGLVLADVDGLKGINDTYGHTTGDRVLREIARLLSVEAGRLPDALAARIGGDEFCLVLTGATRAEVIAAVDQLTAGAADLELCAGLSCGWAIVDSRPTDAPTAPAAARALLRLADAAQYRAKREGKQAGVQALPSSESVPAAELGNRLARQALARLGGLTDPLERLAVVAEAAAEVLDAAAWWVSSQTGDGPLLVRRQGYARVGDIAPDTAWLAEHPGYDVDEYPATRAALAGGSFQASLDHGETSEREYIAAHGYAELVAAGTAGIGERWLVELCGDVLGTALAPHEPTLRVLVELAVHGTSREPDPADPVGRMVTARSGAR